MTGMTYEEYHRDRDTAIQCKKCGLRFIEKIPGVVPQHNCENQDKPIKPIDLGVSTTGICKGWAVYVEDFEELLEVAKLLSITTRGSTADKCGREILENIIRRYEG